jgi:glycosyltransferase involved in cell wall biosynthesis
MPCFNEAKTVLTAVERVLASPWTRELVIVDDASTDGTAALLDTLAQERVRVVRHHRNRGKGASLRTGFEVVSSPYVIVQDADLEYNPVDYGAMLEPLLDGRADVVIGSRFSHAGAHRVLYFWHSVGNKALTLLSNMFTDLNLTDVEACYKAFRLEVVRSLELREDRFGIEPEMVAKVAAGGWRVYEVGVGYDGRTYAEGKKIGWRDGIWALVCIVRYARVGRKR